MVNLQISFNANDINDVEIVKSAVDSIYSKIKNCQDENNVSENEVIQASEENNVGNDIKEEVTKNVSSTDISIVKLNESQIEYYKVTDGKLSETTTKALALYILNKIDAENFEVRINDNYSSPIEAIKNKNSYLIPFCDITEDSDENSNFIETVTPGKAIKIGSDVQIVNKVKVKLIRR